MRTSWPPTIFGTNSAGSSRISSTVQPSRPRQRIEVIAFVSVRKPDRFAGHRRERLVEILARQELPAPGHERLRQSAAEARKTRAKVRQEDLRTVGTGNGE
jgi:hypothetical protein